MYSGMKPYPSTFLSPLTGSSLPCDTFQIGIRQGTAHLPVLYKVPFMLAVLIKQLGIIINN